MPRQPGRQVLVQHHRGHRLGIRDDGGEGWLIFVHGPGSAAARGDGPHKLRSSVPGGLGPLIAEAQRLIDRRLDGGGSPGMA